MAPAHKTIAAFVRRMVKAREGAGWTTERPPWPEPSASDPAGLDAARAALDVDDGRATALLDRLQAAWLADRVDAVETLALARRVVVFSRMVGWGRGARDGAWVSVLRPAELRAAVEACSGAFEPVAPLPDRPGWRAFVREHSAVDATGRAVAETLFALMAGVGGLLIAPRTDLRLCIQDRGDWTAWTLEQKALGTWDHLSFTDGHTQHKVAERILQAESWPSPTAARSTRGTPMSRSPACRPRRRRPRRPARRRPGPAPPAPRPRSRGGPTTRRPGTWRGR
jgi:hypothetical protein